jgi:hypothetical protein
MAGEIEVFFAAFISYVSSVQLLSHSPKFRFPTRGRQLIAPPPHFFAMLSIKGARWQMNT